MVPVRDVEGDFSPEAVDQCVAIIKKNYKHQLQDTEHHCLAFCAFHHALLYNYEMVREILNKLSDKECRYVLTAFVDYNNVRCEEMNTQKFTSQDTINLGDLESYLFNDNNATPKNFVGEAEYRCELPLGLVLYSGNEELLKLVLKSGANVTQTATDGNTVIHLLIKLSERHPEKAVQMYDCLMHEVVDMELRKSLVTWVNGQGMTPLELAVEGIMPEMLHALYNTVGVYKFPLKVCGSYQYVAYDVTMDERQNRLSGKTVLHYLSVVTEEQMKRVHNFKLFDKEPFKSWAEEKQRANGKTALLWMTLWCACVLMYLTSLYWYRDSRDSLAFNITIVMCGLALLLIEACTSFWSLHFYKATIRRVINGLFPAAFSLGYRLFQVLFLLSATTAHALVLFYPDCGNALVNNSRLVVETVAIFFAFMGFMFFTQLNKCIGYYLAVLENMITSTFSFIFLGFCYYVGFATTFFVHYLPDYCPLHHNVTNKHYDVAGRDFSTFWRSQYETLLLILSVTAPKDWYFTDSNNPVITVWIYVMCLVLNTLLLLNLLIAFMNQRMEEMVQFRHTIQKIQQLSFYLLVEEKTLLNNKWMEVLKLPQVLKVNNTNLYWNKSKTKAFLHTVEPSTF